MKVSIIIPAYNAEKTIAATIECLLRQTYNNIEIIVVDDGSQDRTAEVLDNYNDNEKIRIIHKQNGGVSSARNLGIRESTGDCLMFVDADDLCHTDMVESIINKMQSEKVEYVIAGFIRVKEKKRINCLFGDRIFRSKEEIRANIEFIMSNGLNSPYSKLYVTRLIRENHISFDEALPLGEDLNFNLEYLFCVESVAYLDKCIYEYLVFNSIATTIYREDLYHRRMLSLQRMNTTFEENGLINPIENELRIKIFYATLFNLHKRNCPLSFNKKIQLIRDVKREYLSLPRKRLCGIYRVLFLLAYIFPAWVLYWVAKTIQIVMGIFPERIRGVSV